MSIYRWLWFHTEFWLSPEDRRPFTFILRDFYHTNPLLTIIILSASFYALGRWLWLLSLKDFSIMLGTLLIGVILGHLFWGRKYIPGQQESPPYLGGSSSPKAHPKE